jgi:hypothetical protein
MKAAGRELPCDHESALPPLTPVRSELIGMPLPAQLASRGIPATTQTSPSQRAPGRTQTAAQPDGLSASAAAVPLWKCHEVVAVYRTLPSKQFA